MRITIHTESAAPCELQVGTAHHPYPGALPEVGQTLVIPDDAPVDVSARGEAEVTKIIWHYNAAASTLWPEIVCKR